MESRTVFHRVYGRGVVQQERHLGFELRVHFEDGRTRWVRNDEIVDSATHTRSPRSVTPLVDRQGNFRARRMIEALRLGIVPYDTVDEFTYGRDTEIRQLTDWLEQSDDNTTVIQGNYGSGKSHLINYLYGYALNHGFAVARVEMDPNETPFHKPKRVYREIAKTLRFHSQKQGRVADFRAFVSEALDNSTFAKNIYFKQVRQAKYSEDAWAWIGASESVIRPYGNYYHLALRDSATAANVYCYLISALSWAAKSVLKLKGLVVVFDESEAIDLANYSYQYARGENFLQALTRVADSDELLLAPAWQSDLQHSGFEREIPFMFRRPSGLKLAFAFTNVDLPDVAALQRTAPIKLQSLSQAILLRLFMQIRRTYEEAYTFSTRDVDASVVQPLFGSAMVTRMSVKSSVEVLDLYRLRGLEAVSKALDRKRARR